ncbi:MAG TPA: hypothetical protein VFF69_03350 [Phycisphaerales bacterium]|nr:hypothetical protein [Phycisphaerales bacterium]
MAGRSTVGTRGFVPGLVLGLVVGAFAGAVLPPLISGQKLPVPGAGAAGTSEKGREVREPAPPALEERGPAAPAQEQLPEREQVPEGGEGATDDTGGDTGGG